MDDAEITMWGIHSADDRMFLDKNVIAIGWEEMGDLSKVGAGSRDDFKALYRRTYPDKKPGAAPAVAGMLRRFVYEMTVGDYVVFPSKADRMVNIGRITGGYEYHPYNGYIYSNIRTVEWLAKIPRIEFSQGALSEISSLLTLFRIKQYGKEFIARLHGEAPTYDDEETIAASAEAIQENTKDFILKTLSRELKGYDLEPFVANLLNAMGYRTKVMPHGGDSGKDIIAYKDELPPRILVQVKSIDGDIPERMLQALKGTMREGDYGLFVTLSNYTKNAQKYLDINPIIRGINGDELAGLILKYYSQLGEKYQDLIPLKMVYVPVVNSENE